MHAIPAWVFHAARCDRQAQQRCGRLFAKAPVLPATTGSFAGQAREATPRALHRGTPACRQALCAWANSCNWWQSGTPDLSRRGANGRGRFHGLLAREQATQAKWMTNGTQCAGGEPRIGIEPETGAARPTHRLNEAGEAHHFCSPITRRAISPSLRHSRRQNKLRSAWAARCLLATAAEPSRLF